MRPSTLDSPGALNAAAWTAYQTVPLLLLFVCEDNGIGISVGTPEGWVAASLSKRAGLRYFPCDGTDLHSVHSCFAAERYVRARAAQQCSVCRPFSSDMRAATWRRPTAT